MRAVDELSIQYYLRSTRYVLPTLLGALSKGNDPDRMKGALYVLGNKGISMLFHFVSISSRII
jgi:hypothetical protein